MNGPTPTNPTPRPTAVPWTPDMAAGQAQPAPVTPPAPANPQGYAPMPAPQMPQTPITPQSFQAQPPVPQAQAAAHPPMQHGQPGSPQPSLQPAQPFQASSMPQQGHQTPQTMAPQHVTAPPVQPLQMQTPQAHHGQVHPAHGQYAPATAAPQHYAQNAMPPRAALQAQHPAQADQTQSKSLFAKLLNRAPKPKVPSAVTDMPTAAVTATAAAATSTSLFNKNFAVGAVAGLLVGAFVLPMLLNMIGGGDDAAQKQAIAQAQTVTTTAPASGETFIDQAIATKKP